MSLSDWAKLNVQKYAADEDGTTHCNEFVQSACNEIGCHDLDGMLATEMIDTMRGRPQAWKQVTFADAQAIANNDHLVIIGWRNPEEGEHSHVCLVIPGTMIWSNSFGKDLPVVANAGKTTFYGRVASYAFLSDMVLECYIWLG